MTNRKIFPAGLLRVEVDTTGGDEPMIYISALDTEAGEEQAVIVFASELDLLMLALEQAKIEVKK